MVAPPAPIARGGLHPVHAQVTADLAQLDLVAILQIAVLEDHLDLRAACVRTLRHRLQVLPHVIPVFAQDLSDVDDAVQLGAAISQCLSRPRRLS